MVENPLKNDFWLIESDLYGRFWEFFLELSKFPADLLSEMYDGWFTRLFRRKNNDEKCLNFTEKNPRHRALSDVSPEPCHTMCLNRERERRGLESHTNEPFVIWVFFAWKKSWTWKKSEFQKNREKFYRRGLQGGPSRAAKIATKQVIWARKAGKISLFWANWVQRS